MLFSVKEIGMESVVKGINGRVWDIAWMCILLSVIWWVSQALLGEGLITERQAGAGIAACVFGMGLGIAGFRVQRDWKVGVPACLAMGSALTLLL